MENSCRVRERISGFSLTFVRVALGLIFFMHGSQKVLGWYGGQGLSATVQMMQQNGLPAALAYLVCLGEFLGGLGLIFGALSRVAALGIFMIMAGAVVTVHGQHGFFMMNKGYEYNLALMAMAVAIMLGGPGKMAIDHYFCRKDKIPL